MKLVILGATGALGRECVKQSLEAGHEVTVLARTPSTLEPEIRSRVRVTEGDALEAASIQATLAEGCDAVLFAIGIDRKSPEDLCTTATRHLLDSGLPRLVWCGGGSTLVPEDVPSFGARFVEGFASTFMGLRHRDKAHQLELLNSRKDTPWVGLRPLQMNRGEGRGRYRLGFERFGPFSKIYFPDCAHAMLGMLEDDRWLHQAPIIQY